MIKLWLTFSRAGSLLHSIQKNLGTRLPPEQLTHAIVLPDSRNDENVEQEGDGGKGDDEIHEVEDHFDHQPQMQQPMYQ